MDAVGYLDTDILAKHLQEKKGLRQQPKLNISVWRWSVAAAIFTLTIVITAIITHMPSEVSPPNYDELVWGDTYLSSVHSHNDEPFKTIHGLQITHALYNTLQESANSDTIFAIRVYIEKSDSVDYAKQLFEKNEIFGEIKDGNLYIFASRKQIEAMKLPVWKYNNYILDCANKNIYDGTPIKLNAVETDFLNLHYEKFYFSTCTIANLFPCDSGSMYQGYSQLFEELGDRNGYLTITIYPFDDTVTESDYPYIDYHMYNVGAYPTKINYVVRIDKLTPLLFKLMSEDSSVKRVTITTIVHNIPGENGPTNCTE